MRVLVKVVSGLGHWRKTVLRAGESLRFGRTERADVAFPEDGCMSQIHFLLEADHQSCYAEDLNSSNGTLLNGRPLVRRAILRHEDELQAGQTTFKIWFEDTEPTSALGGRTVVMPPMTANPEPRVSSPLASATNIHYRVATTASGATLCQGTIEEIAPGELALRIHQMATAYLLVDFRRPGLSIPKPIASPTYLFDWLDPRATAIASPMVITAEDHSDWPRLLDDGWCNNAVVCLFSRLDRDGVLRHLRNISRMPAKQQTTDDGILGLCWPKVLGFLLAYSTPDYLQTLTAGIDAILLEDAEKPDVWQIFGNENVLEIMDTLRFLKIETT